VSAHITPDTSDMPAAATPGQLLLAQRRLLVVILLFGAAVNLLALSAPLFALQVFDRVLGSRSVETLIALSLLVMFLLAAMTVLDHLRRRIAARVAERIGSGLAATLETPPRETLLPGTLPALIQDADDLRRFLASPVSVALLDLPWIPIFVVATAALHPALGLLAAAGGVAFALPGLALFLGLAEPSPTPRATAHAAETLRDPDLTFSLGGPARVLERWRQEGLPERRRLLRQGDGQALLTSLSQWVRAWLQSAVVALAAYLVLREQMSAGAIIAATVLLARALGPLEMLVQNAPLIRARGAAWKRLHAFARHSAECGPPPGRTLPAAASPAGAPVCAERVTVFPAGSRKAALRMICFQLEPGQKMAVTGPSGAGKTTLARALCGMLPVAGGRLSIAGIPADVARREGLLRIGYLPQSPRFPHATIEAFIAGPETSPAPARIRSSAARVGADEEISALPAGYATRLDPAGNGLPGGLLQKIALARAIHAAPELLVLDEPANNLDAAARQTLSRLIEESSRQGTSVVILTQSPDLARQSGPDLLLQLEEGLMRPASPPFAGQRRAMPADAGPPAPLWHQRPAS